MAEIVLDYSEIKDSSRAAQKVADQCEDFASDLKRKVTKKLGDLKRGSSGNTSAATSYMNAKINELNKKATAFSNFSDDLDNFLNDSAGAKETDKKAAKEIKSYSKIFLKNNDMYVGPITDFFMMLSNTFYNSTEFGQWLKKMNNAWDDFWADAARDIEYWYKCQGGKHVVGVIVAVALAAVAVVAIFSAWPAFVMAASAFVTAASSGGLMAAIFSTAGYTLLTTTAGLVSAVVGIGNGLTDVFYSCKAAAADDPAWAKRYSDIDDMATGLKKHRFESGFLNNLSMKASFAISVVERVCEAIDLFNTAKQGVEFFKLNKNNLTSSWKEMNFREVVDGKKKFTKDSFKSGLEAVKSNYKSVLKPLGEAATKNSIKDAILDGNEKLKKADKVADITGKIFKGVKDYQDGGFGKMAWGRAKDETKYVKYTFDVIECFDKSRKLVMD